jgi:hypothetical protein
MIVTKNVKIFSFVLFPVDAMAAPPKSLLLAATIFNVVVFAGVIVVNAAAGGLGVKWGR